MKETRKITLEEIQLPIAGKIRSYEEYIASILHSDNRYVASITDYILSNRGKQLRPLLVLLSRRCTAKWPIAVTWEPRSSR